MWQLCLGDLQKNSRSEIASFYGEWRAGRTRDEKRAAKRAKYLGIPLQGGENGGPELFFYGVKSGVVGLKVADVAQACTEFKDASQFGYDKVCPPFAIQCCYIMCLCTLQSVNLYVHPRNLFLGPFLEDWHLVAFLIACLKAGACGCGMYP